VKRLFRAPGRERIPEEVDDEVRFHLERKVEALVRQGMTREAAEREARRRFGDLGRVKAERRTASHRREARMRRAEWVEGLGMDLRYAVRQLARNPVFAGIAVLTLALGIGVNSAIFSVVDGVLFRPLPFPEPDELVVLWADVTERGGPDDEWLSYANFDDIRTRAEGLEALAAWGGARPVWTDPPRPRQLLGAQVTAGMFSRVLQVEPALGRSFRAEEDVAGGPSVTLLSHGLWEVAFGADPDVLGTTMTLNDATFRIVGVMPEDFRPPFVPGAELWTLVQADPAAQEARRGNFSWRSVGRLRDGVGVEAAGAEVDRIGAALRDEHPESNTGMGFALVPLRDDLVAESRTALLVLLGAVGVVLLVACINVANLLLARAAARRPELAIRAALGAGRRRIGRQLLTESLVLAGVGGVVGVGIAFAATHGLVSVAPDALPRVDGISVDGRVIAFTALVTLFSGLFFGVAPALRVLSGGPGSALREGGRGQLGTSRSLAHSGLVVGQVAMALVLLVTAGLLVRSLENLRSAELAFQPEGVLTARITLPPSRYGSPADLVSFADRLEERMAGLPGVVSVGATGTVPLTGFDGDVSFFVEGRPIPGPGEGDAAWIRPVTPGYFETMGIDVVRGRAFDATDREGDSEVLIINETLADRLFAGEDPIGQRVTFGDPRDPEAFWREIVGVARDVRNFGIREGSRYAVYSPWAQTPFGPLWPVVRADGPLEPVADALRAEVAAIDPGLAVALVRPMTEIVRAELAADRFVAFLLSLFAAVTLVLAVIGLYGVVSYGVSRRTREVGVRMALGAGAGRISRSIVGGSLALVGIGLLVGLVGAWLATRLVEGLLYGVPRTDPLTFAVVVLVLTAATVAAAAIPAMRAARVPPTEALRAE